MTDRIFHLVPVPLWDAHRSAGGGPWRPPGFEREGFAHLSTAAQLAETIRLHTDPEVDLWLFELSAEAAGDALRWEESRGGQLFPHLYRPIEIADVRFAWRLPRRGADSSERPLPNLSAEPLDSGARAGAPD